MDDLARYNMERWDALARAGCQYSRPFLDLDADLARTEVDPEGMLDEIAGRNVLCLAGGGGQQSAAFALLGARVTVLDLSRAQLERDQQAARHYGVQIATVHGDMRDLSCFADDSFDTIWHGHSLDFVPEVGPVFDEIARVIRPGGMYRTSCSNPFSHATCEEQWDGKAYPLADPYVEGAEIVYDDPCWELDEDGAPLRIQGPREFRHTLSTLVNGLIERGFAILGVWEGPEGDPDAEPGTWEHFTAIAPPWLTFWAAYRREGVEGLPTV